MTSPLSPEAVAQMVADMQAGTPGPWQYRPDQYDDWGVVKSGGCVICQARDPARLERSVLAEYRENGTDPWESNARRIARLPDLEAAYLTLAAENATLRAERDEARTWLGAANNEFGSAAWDWPDLWRRISQLKELSNSRWQSLNAAQDELATLRASEAAALGRVKVLEEALMIYADSCDETETKSCGYDGNMCCRSARAALTPTADKEPKT